MSNRAHSASPLALDIFISAKLYAYTRNDNFNTLYRESTPVWWEEPECLTFNSLCSNHFFLITINYCGKPGTEVLSDLFNLGCMGVRDQMSLHHFYLVFSPAVLQLNKQQQQIKLGTKILLFRPIKTKLLWHSDNEAEYKLLLLFVAPKYLMHYIVSKSTWLRKTINPIITTLTNHLQPKKEGGGRVQESKLPDESRVNKWESKLHFHGKHLSNTIQMKFKQSLSLDKFQTTVLKESVHINIFMVYWMWCSILNHLQYLQGNILNRTA